VGFVFSPRRIHHAASFVTHKIVPSHFPGIAANSWTRSGSLNFGLKFEPIEMPKFRKTLFELKSHQDKRFYALKNLTARRTFLPGSEMKAL